MADPKRVSELGLITAAALASNDRFYLADASAGVDGSVAIIYSELLLALAGTFATDTELSDGLVTKSDISHTHTFASLTSKPTTLAGYGITDAAPLVHTHAFVDITGKPTTLAGYGITDAANISHTHSYGSLTGIPGSFPPSAHGHPWSDISGTPTTLAGYGITDASINTHTHTFASLTSKPTTLAGYGITDAAPSANVRYTDLHFTIDGGGSVITTGFKGVLPVDFNGDIDQVTILAADGLTGSIVVDVKKSTYSGFPTQSSIAASAKPTISSSSKGQDSTLTGWTKGLTSGDILGFTVDSVSTLTRVHLALRVLKAV